jgi:hypothetical protein
MQILNPPSVIMSPDAKRVKGSAGIGAPDLPALLPVPARKSRKPTSPRSFALNLPVCVIERPHAAIRRAWRIYRRGCAFVHRGRVILFSLESELSSISVSSQSSGTGDMKVRMVPERREGEHPKMRGGRAPQGCLMVWARDETVTTGVRGPGSPGWKSGLGGTRNVRFKGCGKTGAPQACGLPAFRPFVTPTVLACSILSSAMPLSGPAHATVFLVEAFASIIANRRLGMTFWEMTGSGEPLRWRVC